MVESRSRKPRGLILIIVFLAGVTLFSVIKYIRAQKENYHLYNNLKQIKAQTDSLEIQRQKLLQTIEKQNQENSVIKEDLKANQDTLTKMEADFMQAQKTIVELNSQISALKSENANLEERGEGLKIELTEVSQEKDKLQAKLNSLIELKKAIRELKIKIHQAKAKLIKKTDIEIFQEGNRGFVVKDGKFTYPAKVKIEVKPAP